MMEKTQLKIANKPLSTRQLVAAEALATGMSQREVCREQGISRSVLQSWLKKPDFVAQVEEFRQAILVEVRGRLLKLLPDATEALADTIRQPRTRSPSTCGGKLPPDGVSVTGCTVTVSDLLWKVRPGPGVFTHRRGQLLSVGNHSRTIVVHRQL